MNRSKYMVKLALDKISHERENNLPASTIATQKGRQNAESDTSTYCKIQGQSISVYQKCKDVTDSEDLSQDEGESFYDYDDDVRDPLWKADKRDKTESDSDSEEELLSNRTYVKKLKRNFSDVNNNLPTVDHTENDTNTSAESQGDENITLPEAEHQSDSTSAIGQLGIFQVDHEEVVGEKRRRAEPAKWQKNVSKRRRMEGKAYRSVKKGQDGKYTVVEKGARIIGPCGCSKRCEKGLKGRKCRDFTNEDREDIFGAFWDNMTWEAKKVFVISLVDIKPCPGKEGGRRSKTYMYHLKHSGVKVPVCKMMFLSTLGIGEKSVYAWLEEGNHNNGTPNKPVASARGRKSDEGQQSARKFLTSIPKLPSHYCRSETTKQYVEPTFSTLSEIYKVYCDFCVANNLHCASRRVFSEVFESMNMSLFHPKKDQCDTCCSYNTGNLTESEYVEHIAKKEEARSEKISDKERAIDNADIKMITVDVQAVLLTPLLQASAMYYKSKLACHNYTIYDVATKDVKTYFWHEGEGDLSANSFASCLTDYIGELPENIREVIIFSDGCTYQNRNSILSNALLNLCIKKNITIVQKYLAKGHTQMECDSIHSSIERRKRGKPIYSPHTYISLMEQCRPSQPFSVTYLTHGFFKDFTKLSNYPSIRPGSRPGEPVVTDLCCLMYCPDGRIQYKLRFTDMFTDLNKRATRRSSLQNQGQVTSLHTRPLPIKATKFAHLQDLKSVIPRDYHGFYDALSHE